MDSANARGTVGTTVPADGPDGRERAGDGPGAAPRYMVVLACAAAVCYASFLLEHLFSPQLDAVNGYVSELSAADQPFRFVYGGGDALTGVMTLTIVVGALRRLRRRPLATAGWTFLGAFGVGAIGDAVFPLDCAPSLQTGCALRERSEHVSFSHTFHSFTSSAVIFCGVAALLLLSLAARRYGWWPPLARWGWLLALTESVFALGTLAAMYHGQWLGIVQRFQIAILCLGLLTIAWALHADRRRAARAAPDVRPEAAG
ncbi:DUF998 domain-containing protein [Actinomadura algeriensis]|uniref:DUF998 domain-containing protein n=1 Tax=Actinomadura algeriensis TaxID=1679523 RepID=A0ABR9JLK3_9ACTN|nr:DUF998 domain-containing protein [Actinomadura algeriensis]MBE1531425.1 hypothetical protein [Actinomadura algeriensis]